MPGKKILVHYKYIGFTIIKQKVDYFYMLIHNVKCVCPKARVMSALVRYIDEKFEN